MHAEHAEGQRMGTWKTAQSHQRHRDRDLGNLSQLPNLIRRIGENSPSSDIHHRLPGLHDLFGGLFDLVLVPSNGGIIAAQTDLVGIFELGLFRAHILGNIDQDRTGPAARRDIERFLDRLRQVMNIFH